MMPRLIISNVSQELTSDCCWTDELVALSYGDLYVDGRPFGTYIAACYPNTRRPPQFIINVVNEAGRPVLSVPFEIHLQSPDLVLPVSPDASPWSEDGLVVGPIPDETERRSYSRAADVFAVASALVAVEVNVAEYTRGV